MSGLKTATFGHLICASDLLNIQYLKLKQINYSPFSALNMHFDKLSEMDWFKNTTSVILLFVLFSLCPEVQVLLYSTFVEDLFTLKIRETFQLFIFFIVVFVDSVKKICLWQVALYLS